MRLDAVCRNIYIFSSNTIETTLAKKEKNKVFFWGSLSKLGLIFMVKLFSSASYISNQFLMLYRLRYEHCAVDLFALFFLMLKLEKRENFNGEFALTVKLDESQLLQTFSISIIFHLLLLLACLHFDQRIVLICFENILARRRN